MVVWLNCIVVERENEWMNRGETTQGQRVVRRERDEGEMRKKERDLNAMIMIQYSNTQWKQSRKRTKKSTKHKAQSNLRILANSVSSSSSNSLDDVMYSSKADWRAASSASRSAIVGGIIFMMFDCLNNWLNEEGGDVTAWMLAVVSRTDKLLLVLVSN